MEAVDIMNNFVTAVVSGFRPLSVVARGVAVTCITFGAFEVPPAQAARNSHVPGSCGASGRKILPKGRGGAASRSSKSVEIRRVGVLVMPSGAVPEGRGSPPQSKGVGLPGITRKRVGFPLKILD